ncbi:TonB-dependent receptor [Massilia sp. PAMC28688]|uniref:TonB-dependent receptor n=1 Tax=Massilia sp. PAMC28688 TaxID=2861283 RepID=UPI001C639F59|nr:TonB-dependent receptor [Massilia sp. PAMC28688]QYF94042.1 TonB-dependent receptor [Massilia sp. PAMC28688]
MHSSVVLRRAIACAFAFSPAFALAQPSLQTLPRIDVLGARFASDPSLLPISASVITADDIRRAGASDVNQAIRKIGGVYGRQSLDGSSDFTLDLRGFGENSSQNLVVMLDGVRLSENDLGGAVLSTIPIETVERIEIVRGGSSVLFGGGATGGVIQIVTRRPAANTTRASLRAEAGQFGLADARATLSTAWNSFALDAAVGAQRTDNYRDHNEFDQSTFSGGAQWQYKAGRTGLRVDSARQDAQFAGSLSLAQFETNPRDDSTPRDTGSLDADRISAFVEHRFGTLDLAAELSRRDKTTSSTYYFGDSASRLTYDTRQTQFSPRLRHLAQTGSVLNELVAGIDLVRWTRLAAAAGYSARDAQKSRAVYLRNEARLDGPRNARLAIGARRELVERSAPFDDNGRQDQNAWEVQGSADAVQGVNLYLKTGRSFRLPTADENGFRQAGALRIQTSRDLEAGARLGAPALGATLRFFRHRLTDEIFYDPTLGDFGANTNLAPTERRGVELEARKLLTPALALTTQLQHVRARFIEGANAGREMVLVPKNVVTARLSWAPGNGHSADAGAQWVDSQRYGGDFTNSCGARIPSYVTLDARYARTVGQWEFALAGTNLADRQHFSQAFLCRGAIYPGDGRQVRLSARYDFK